MRRRGLHALLVALTALAATACQPPRLPAGAPVILVVVDTLRADRLGTYGYASPTSPEIDRWAAQGVVFERAFATSPWTLPSTASLLTGRHPYSHGAGRFETRSRGKRRRKNVGLAPEVPTLASLLSQRGYRTGAFVTNTFLAPAFGLDHGFDDYDAMRHKGAAQRPAPLMVDRALEWIEAQGDAPFLLLLHLMDPHLPYGPPPPARGRFAAERVGRFSAPVELKQIRHAHPPPSPQERDYVSALYDEEVAHIDLEVGRFLDALSARGTLDRALVVLASDHGEELWEHGGFEHGHAFHQELLHVPLVFWAPGLEPARVATPVSLVDLLPTVLDGLGLPTPEGVDGSSLWPAVRGGRAPRARALLAHNTLRGPDRQVLVQWPWKLVAYVGNDPPRLYDLEADPGETRDLAEQEPGRRDRMLARLREIVPRDGASAQGRAVRLDAELRRELEALGYVEPGEAP